MHKRQSARPDRPSDFGFVAQRYGVAVGCVVAAAIARTALDPFIHDELPFASFFAAVAAASMYGGRGPGLLSATLGFAAAEFLFVHRGNLGWRAEPIDFVFAAIYALVCSVVIYLVAALSEAREKAVRREKELEAEINERIRAETTLRKLHHNLEKIVQERTAELEASLKVLASEKKRLRDVLDRLPVSVALLSPDYGVKFANQMFRSRCGEPGDRPCYEYIAGRSAPCNPCQSRRCVETLESNQWERVLPDRSVYRVFAFPYRDSDGSVLVLQAEIDLTEIMQAKARLAQQAALLEMAHDAILVTDSDGKIAFWNKGAEQLYGWTASEAMGANATELLSTQSSPPVDEIRKIVGTDGQWEGELRQITRHGLARTVASRWSIEKDHTSSRFQVLEINRDITTRKRIEEELRSSQKRLDLALHAAEAGDFEFDIQQNSVTWSRQVAGLYGVGMGALPSTYEDWEKCVLPEDHAVLRSALLEALRYGEFRCEFRVRRRDDGRIRWMSGRATVLRDAAGLPSRMVGFKLDVTDRRQADEAIRQSEERYRALALATSLIVWSSDAEGRVSEAPSWQAFTGQTAEQWRDEGWAAALHPEDRKEALELWAAALRNGQPYRTEFRVRRHDGQYFDVAIRSAPVLAGDGSVREWISACTDITERKQAERALHKVTSELSRSNSELQQFAYAASHDLQEPLRMIAGFTQLLAKRYGNQLDQDAREFIGYAVDGATRMQKLITDLLTLSRAGTHGLTVKLFPVQEAVEHALQNLRLSIEEAGARVTYDGLPQAFADSSQMTQLFQNLISNALRFRSDESPVIHIAAEWRAGRWRISVSDNGIGFEPQFAERIFVVFQRLHTSEEYPGTGIGLAICKKIVERHQGRIWAESKPGLGSTFYFTLPGPCPAELSEVSSANQNHRMQEIRAFRNPAGRR